MTPAGDDGPSLEGRILRSPEAVEGGDVGAETLFEFQQDGDLVTAAYSGGSVRQGFLVGRLVDGVLDARYAQLTVDGFTSTGHTVDRIEVLADGRVRLHERWSWDSRPGSGTSVLEELEG